MIFLFVFIKWQLSTSGVAFKFNKYYTHLIDLEPYRLVASQTKYITGKEEIKNEIFKLYAIL